MTPCAVPAREKERLKKEQKQSQPSPLFSRSVISHCRRGFPSLPRRFSAVIASGWPSLASAQRPPSAWPLASPRRRAVQARRLAARRGQPALPQLVHHARPELLPSREPVRYRYPLPVAQARVLRGLRARVAAPLCSQNLACSRRRVWKKREPRENISTSEIPACRLQGDG